MVATRSVVVGVMMVLGTVAGCAAPVEDDVGAEESANVTSELKWRTMDDVPAPTPVDHPIPIPVLQNHFYRPIWDLQRYFEELERPRGLADLVRCYQYDQEIFDPSRGRNVSIPITVCP